MLLAILSFLFVLYATYLTRSGVLQDFSVHSFVDLGINDYLVGILVAATALGFGLFATRPSPFCLLDEVDAPLDDTNTERYAKLVSSMAKETQFLFISHNKIAMEMAEQLIGVTMQEQGVSRIVAVDMESAPILAWARARGLPAVVVRSVSAARRMPANPGL